MRAGGRGGRAAAAAELAGEAFVAGVDRVAAVGKGREGGAVAVRDGELGQGVVDLGALADGLRREFRERVTGDDDEGAVHGGKTGRVASAQLFGRDARDLRDGRPQACSGIGG